MSASESVTVPAAYALEVTELARRFGVGDGALLDGSGLTLERLRDPSARLSIAACAALTDRAKVLTGEPGLAFYMAMQTRISAHGFLGFAAMTAKNVREALDLAVTYSATRTEAFALSTFVEGDTASLVLEERAPLGSLREFAVVAVLLGIANLGGALIGTTLSGAACCAFPMPDYFATSVRKFARHFQGAMRFDEPAHRLVFASSYLDLPLLSADPVAMQLARAQCEKELFALTSGAGFVGRVRAAMSDEAEGPRALDEVAKRLHVSPRTLKRALAAQGTSFSELRDEALAQRALLLLEGGKHTIAAIASALGYSDEANFTRAFRRWTGETPAAFQRRRRR